MGGRGSAVLRGASGPLFVRALLELPVDGEEGYFGYGTWIEVTHDDFDAAR